MHIASAYTEMEQYDQAIKAANSINSMWDRASAIQVIAFQAAENGQVDQAFETVNLLRTKFSKVSWAPDHTDFLLSDSLAAQYAEKGQLDQALKVAKIITYTPEQEKWIGLINCARK